jgi:hypothetical protein
VKLCMNKGLIWPNDWILHLDNAPANKALYQAVSGPRISYWNDALTLFPRFGSEWLLAVSRNKICLIGTKISDYWRHPGKCDYSTESYSTSSRTVSHSGSIFGLSAYLLKGSTSKVIPRL